RLAQELGVSVDALFGRLPETGFFASQGAERVAEGPDHWMTLREDSVSYGYTSAPVTPFLPFLDTPGGLAAVAAANELAKAFLALEDLCGAMKCAVLPLYIPFVATETGMEQLTTQVRHHLGITQAVVFDYLELLENAGLRVVFCDLPAGRDDAAVISLSAYDRLHSNALFFIRRSLTPERRLFRLLFELGRIYWHTRQLIAGVAPASASEPLDEVHVARKFAAFLLLPALAVRATVSQLGIAPGDWTYELLLRIKHRFGVSAETFCIRLEELGLIEAKLAADFKARIRAHYEAHANTEPDGSMRRLSYNGRLGDLLLNAQGKAGEAGEEARAIAAKLEELGLTRLSLADTENKALISDSESVQFEQSRIAHE
ncbi:MAG: ImmA/IrrE family metallo-endopeptidase, partial [Lentisphaerae bacterium]|nr:ImmA/IrrE family metallo-endopeptidase [Lentisphaerota bacterium]